VLGARLLGQADVILHDRLIAPDLLTRYARRDAKIIPVGKSRDHHARTQDEIGVLIVVRLKGGDPGIYAHSAEEIAVAAKLGVPYQIVPGITAALGCAASSGIPLTERGGANGVHFLTLYDERLHDTAFWRALAVLSRDTFVFYMSTGHFARVCELLCTAGFAGETPALLVEQGTTPQHTEFEAPLGEFAARYAATHFLTPALLIVGDVVRWRREHGWREEPRERAAYFAEHTNG